MHDKAFHIAKNLKYDRYQRGLASIVSRFFDKNILVVVVVLYYMLLYVNTAPKTVLSNSWNIMESSKSTSKYHLSFKFMDEKRLDFPSRKSSKWEIFSNH